MKRSKTKSDYVARDYASLHIKRETRQRLNVAKSHVQARHKKFISQDEFINLLLNHYGDKVPAFPEREAVA